MKHESRRRNVLVVSTVEHAEEEIGRFLDGDDLVKVVVPVVRQGIIDWLANDERAFGHAQSVAGDTAEGLPGEPVEAVAGEADVPLAVRDALATFAADEIVIAVRPHDEEGIVESFATSGVPHGSVGGIPVRLVVVRGS